MFRCNLFVFTIFLVLGVLQARQIRISRYNTQIEEDTELEAAKVEELKRNAPYPAAGYRPGRAFPLPNKAETTEVTTTESDLNLSTTTSNYDELGTTTTLGYDTTESSTIYNDVPAELTAENNRQAKELAEKEAPYPAAGYRPGKAFNLPNEVPEEVPEEETVAKQAPYPAAGYQPRIPFILPTEVIEQSLIPLSLIIENNNENPASTAVPTIEVNSANKTTDDVSKHPACGVSTNPLHPVPAPGTKQEPEAETVLVEAPVGSAVITTEIPLSLLEYRSQPLLATPLIVRPRSWIYTEPVQEW